MGEPEHMGLCLWNPHHQSHTVFTSAGPRVLPPVTVVSGDSYWEGVLASSGWRPGKLLIIPQCTGRPHSQEPSSPCGQSVSVRSPGLGIFCQSGEDGMIMFILFFKNISQDRRKRCFEWMFHLLGKAFVRSTCLHLSTSYQPGGAGCLRGHLDATECQHSSPEGRCFRSGFQAHLICACGMTSTFNVRQRKMRSHL